MDVFGNHAVIMSEVRTYRKRGAMEACPRCGLRLKHRTVVDCLNSMILAVRAKNREIAKLRTAVRELKKASLTGNRKRGTIEVVGNQ